MSEINTSAEDLKAKKQLTTIIYALYAFSFFVSGVPAIVAIIINYIKLEEMQGTFLDSHFRWQMKTFWYSLTGVVMSLLFMTVFIGWFMIGWFGLAAVFVWYVYRIVKGWLNLGENKPMPV